MYYTNSTSRTVYARASKLIERSFASLCREISEHYTNLILVVVWSGIVKVPASLIIGHCLLCINLTI